MSTETPLEKLQRLTVEAAVDEFCRKKRHPISFVRARFTSYSHPRLEGMMTLSEPRRLWDQSLVGTFEGDIIVWILDDYHRFELNLRGAFTIEELLTALHLCSLPHPSEASPDHD